MDYKSLLVVAGISAVVALGMIYIVNHNSTSKRISYQLLVFLEVLSI